MEQGTTLPRRGSKMFGTSSRVLARVRTSRKTFAPYRILREKFACRAKVDNAWSGLQSPARAHPAAVVILDLAGWISPSHPLRPRLVAAGDRDRPQAIIGRAVAEPAAATCAPAIGYGGRGFPAGVQVARTHLAEEEAAADRDWR